MSDASDLITEYLSVGGLFNPEMMNQMQHDAVRFTLIKARDDIQYLERENAALRKLLDTHILRSDLFSYLAWLEDHRDHGDFELEGSKYLVLASDGTTCWGTTFMEAVQIAEQHDRAAFDAARKEDKS